MLLLEGGIPTKEFSMKKQVAASLLAMSLLFGAGGVAQASWLDVLSDLGQIWQTHQAKRQANKSLPKLETNDILGVGEAQRVFGPNLGGNQTLTLVSSQGSKFLFQAGSTHFTLTSMDGSSTYYTSDDINGDPVGRYEVRELKVSDPNTRLWAVIYDCNGNSRCYYGFWLFGERNNRIFSYVNNSMMSQLEMPLPSYKTWDEDKGSHRIDLSMEDGVLKGYYNYQFWPPDVSHAEAWVVLDKDFTIGWNKGDQKFEISDIRQKDQVLGDGSDIYNGVFNWRDMTADERAYYENGLQAIRTERKSYLDRVSEEHRKIYGVSL